MANYPKTIRSLVRTIIPLFGLLYPIAFLLAASGLVSIDWNGFGVDSEGNIYIGQKSKICVYEESVCIRTIDIPQYRSYYFTIDHDEILMASPTHVYTFDLNGQMLSKESDPSGSAYSDLQWTRNVQTATGAQYRRTHRFFRDAVITEDGTVVYQMPTGDYLAKLLHHFSMVAFVIFGVKILLKQ